MWLDVWVCAALLDVVWVCVRVLDAGKGVHNSTHYTLAARIHAVKHTCKACGRSK